MAGQDKNYVHREDFYSEILIEDFGSSSISKCKI
jgi:hypothetical protein